MPRQCKTERRLEKVEKPKYLAPLTIRKKVWKNRFVVAPMIGMEIKDGMLTDEAKAQIRFYGQGGAAEYIVGETEVSPDAFRGPAHLAFDFHREDNQQGMREYAAIIKDELDSIAMVELCHAGESKVMGLGSEICGPMEYIRASDGAHIHGMTEQDIQNVINNFVYAAQTCNACGFDGVVLHGGHGWLFHQFISPHTNRRTDRFGGSIENRTRFLCMTLDAIRNACGEDFVLECRISGAENTGHDSYTIEEITQIAQILSQHCDILHISAGVYRDPAETQMMSTIYSPHGCNVPVAAKIKAAVPIPISVVGGINSPELCEDIISSGKADLIVMCRQWIADPHFLHKLEQGRATEIRPCIRCTRCFPGPFESLEQEFMVAKAEGKPYRPIEEMHSCSVNPVYACGTIDNYPPANKKKRVLVVGGGCAGMQAAITAADRGHTVLLVEKSDRLGGILNFATDDETKGDLSALARAMESELRHKNIVVYTQTLFTPELVEKWAADAVIAAVGSSPAVPPIDGLDSRCVVQAMKVYQKGFRADKNVVILGGGTVGCETAVHLAQQGCRVTIVEMMNVLCPDAYRLHGIKLRAMLERLGCNVLLNTTCRKITEGAVLVSRRNNELTSLPCACVVNALGMQPNPVDEIRAICEGREYYAIGDCVSPRNIASAIEGGYRTALGL